MSETNLLHHFNFILDLWRDRLDYVEWQKCQVIPVPKSGDISNTNKWIGVNLMDIGAKVFSSMICRRLFKIISLHGVKYHFGYSLGVGCQDGLFTLKTSLHARHNHNLPTFVVFVYQVQVLRHSGSWNYDRNTEEIWSTSQTQISNSTHVFWSENRFEDRQGKGWNETN